MNLKVLALAALASLSLAVPATLAHPVAVNHGHTLANPHTTANAIYCGDEFFEDGSFSRMIHNPHGTFYSGGSPVGDETEIAFAIQGSNILSASWLSTGTGDFRPESVIFYTTSGSDLNFGGFVDLVTGRNGVLHWTYNRSNYSLPSGARVVAVVFADGENEDAYTDTASNISANGLAVVPVPGLTQDCALFDAPF